MVNLRELFEIVNSLRRTNSRDNIVGAAREKIVEHVLQDMKKEGEIRDFLKTSGENTSWADLIEGIDFYVINAQYKVFTLSVTGPGWVDVHLQRHPEVPVVVVDLKDENVFQRTREQIREVLSAH